MHQTKNGNQWYFGAKMYISADAGLRLVHTVLDIATNTHEVTPADPDMNWHLAMNAHRRRVLHKDIEVNKLTGALEVAKVGIRAKVEHPFWVWSRACGAMSRCATGASRRTQRSSSRGLHCQACGWRASEFCSRRQDRCVHR